MEKKKVYVVETIADWHSDERRTFVDVFEDFKSAYDYMLKDVKGVIKDLTGYHYSELEVEKYTEDGAYIMTDREDCFTWTIHCAEIN